MSSGQQVSSVYCIPYRCAKMSAKKKFGFTYYHVSNPFASVCNLVFHSNFFHQELVLNETSKLYVFFISIFTPRRSYAVSFRPLLLECWL